MLNISNHLCYERHLLMIFDDNKIIINKNVSVNTSDIIENVIYLSFGFLCGLINLLSDDLECILS